MVGPRYCSREVGGCVDEVCEFIRTTPRRFGLIDYLVFVDDVIPLTPLRFDGMEGVYGGDTARARVMAGLKCGLGVIHLEVIGTTADVVVELYGKVRSGRAPWHSCWSDSWVPFDFEAMRWPLTVLASS